MESNTTIVRGPAALPSSILRKEARSLSTSSNGLSSQDSCISTSPKGSSARERSTSTRSTSSRVSFGQVSETFLFDRRKPAHGSSTRSSCPRSEEGPDPSRHSLIDLSMEDAEAHTPVIDFSIRIDEPSPLTLAPKMSWQRTPRSPGEPSANFGRPTAATPDSFSAPVPESNFPANPGLLRPVSRLGNGLYSEVFSAQTPAANLGVVKIFFLPKCSQDQNVLLAGLEAMVAKLRALPHTNLIRCYGIDVVGPRLQLYSEQAQATLAWVLEAGPLPERTARQYCKGALTGLAFLHASNICHGCLKPSNMLVASNGIVKLCDYGVGQILQQFIPPGMPGLLYMGPEQLSGADPSCPGDVWSIGCVAAEMLTQQRPWEEVAAESDEEAIAEHIIRSPTRPGADVPLPRAQLFLSACLQRDPSARPGAATLKAHIYMQGV